MFDPEAAAIERLTDDSAVAHNSPASGANVASIVFACLPSQAVSRHAAFGPDGVVHGSAIRIYAEMSTIGKEAIELIAQALIDKSIETVETAITGGVPAVRAGTHSMLVSGAPASIDTVSALLSTIVKDVYRLGDRPNIAQVMKLVNNLVMAGNMIVASKSLVLGSKAGLDTEMMLWVPHAGTDVSYVATQVLRNAVDRAFKYGAALSIIDKDVAVSLREASLLGVSMPVIDLASTIRHSAYEAGRGGEDFTRKLQVTEEQNGTQIRSRPG